MTETQGTQLQEGVYYRLSPNGPESKPIPTHCFSNVLRFDGKISLCDTYWTLNPTTYTVDEIAKNGWEIVFAYDARKAIKSTQRINMYIDREKTFVIPQGGSSAYYFRDMDAKIDRAQVKSEIELEIKRLEWKAKRLREDLAQIDGIHEEKLIYKLP